MKEIIRRIIPDFFISWYHLKLAFLGAIFYGFPSRKLKVIGVTGTNGKSTVIYLATKILEQAGFKTASISSIKFKIGDKEWKNDLKMTMPGRFKLQKFLHQSAIDRCEYAVLEVTSEGIKQHRHKYINFDTAVFTNLTPEHIEAHGSFERYCEAKGKLFRAAKNVHIINIDDKKADYFLKFPSYQKFCYSANENLNIEKLKIDWKLKIENYKFIKAAKVNKSSRGIGFMVGNTPFRLSLLGGFNVYNALAAISVALSQGISLETCQSTLEKIEGIPGRMETVIKEPFRVIIDYAHTPDSLKKVYETLKNNNLVCVLGAAGGGRDKRKREELGKIAGQYCTQIIITNEDPYDENPMEIIEQVAKGANKGVKKILDRREAIKTALKSAKPKDVIIITGKGCEPWICIARGKKIAWDDREIVKEEMKLDGLVDRD